LRAPLAFESLFSAFFYLFILDIQAPLLSDALTPAFAPARRGPME
jgi:hypothetical protein